MTFPDLRIKARQGTYARGQESIELILRTTFEILVEEGYRAISLRKIAKRCDMKVGNVTYYFRSKDHLIREMLEAFMEGYVDAFDDIVANTDTTAEEKLASVLRLILADIQTKKTTRVFPELWALANYDDFAAQLVEYCYNIERAVLRSLVSEINPALPEEEMDALCVYVSGSLEGMTMFAGYEKPFANKMPLIANIAVESLVNIVKNATTSSIRGC